jgi:hypothetical protein
MYARHYGSRFISERNYAYEDFLTAQGVLKPSQLRGTENLDRGFLLYYLESVCATEVMQASTAFYSPREVEEERLAICVLLAEIDPDHRGRHEQEIRDLTRALVVRKGVREVEQSKIFIDTIAIRQWADKHLKESFARYQALVGAGFGAGTAALDEALMTVLTGGTGAQDLLKLPKNEASDLLVSMITGFFHQCLSSSEHGLDCYLSMRIRHGALAGQLRAPLEQERIISQREGIGEVYKSNEYWLSTLEGDVPNVILKQVDTRLRTFSQAFDDFVENLASEYIQIRSSNKPNGLFDINLSHLLVRWIADNLGSTAPFESFIALCLTLFWEMLEHHLLEIHKTIDQNINPTLNKMFVTLRADLHKITEMYNIAELDTSIVNAQTKTHQALAQVKDWFRIPTSKRELEFSFDELVQIGLQCVKNIHPEFAPDLSVAILDDLPQFEQLAIFSDIFFIIFDNIRRHAGILGPEVSISCRVVNNRLRIRVTNEVAASARTPENQRKVAQIRELITEGNYVRAVRSEGGTGLIKLRNIIRTNNDPTRLEFDFVDNQFYVQIDLLFQLIQISSAGVETVV